MAGKSEFVVTNSRPETKIHFFNFLKRFVTHYSLPESYQMMRVEKSVEAAAPLGFSGFIPCKVRKGVLITDPEIHINENDFIFEDGSDYRDLIKYVELHELAEIWTVAARGLNKSKQQLVSDESLLQDSHRRSLIEEWAEAIKNGDGERYREFFTKYRKRLEIEEVSEMCDENERAYRKIKKVWGL